MLLLITAAIMLYRGNCIYGLYSCEGCLGRKTRLELTEAEVGKVVLQSSFLSEDWTASARTPDRLQLRQNHHT